MILAIPNLLLLPYPITTVLLLLLLLLSSQHSLWFAISHHELSAASSQHTLWFAISHDELFAAFVVAASLVAVVELVAVVVWALAYLDFLLLGALLVLVPLLQAFVTIAAFARFFPRSITWKSGYLLVLLPLLQAFVTIAAFARFVPRSIPWRSG